jgi:hypothetical protein
MLRHAGWARGSVDLRTQLLRNAVPGSVMQKDCQSGEVNGAALIPLSIFSNR